MPDLSLDRNFSVHLNSRKDIATVTGREKFEQSVVVALTDYISDSVFGAVDEETIQQKLRLEASRVAQRHNQLTGVSNINITPDREQPNTYRVRIVYESDAVFSTVISE